MPVVNFSHDYLHITAWLLEFVVKRCVCTKWQLCSVLRHTHTHAIKLNMHDFLFSMCQNHAFNTLSWLLGGNGVLSLSMSSLHQFRCLVEIIHIFSFSHIVFYYFFHFFGFFFCQF